MKVPDVPTDLFAKIKTKECAVFVGAGLSEAAKLPGWKRLLAELVEIHFESGGNRDERTEVLRMLEQGRLVDVAEYVRLYMKHRTFRDSLVKLLDSADIEPSDLHRTLAKLPFSAVVTTNYDHLLEDTYGRHSRTYCYDNLSALGSLVAEKRFFILKAHGTLDDPDNIIFARSDYHRVMFDSPSYQVFFSSLFSSRTFLFVGYSLSDPDLTILLEGLADIFKGYGHMHYALIPDPGQVERNLLERRFNIQTIAYVPSSPDHPEISLFFESVLRMLAAEDERLEQEERGRLHAQTMETLGQLAGGITHDFNNYLATIIGHAQRGQEVLPDVSEARHSFETIEKAGSDAATLTRRLLESLRGFEGETKVVDLSELLINSLDMLHTLAGEDVDLQLALADNLWRVTADSGSIAQVLVNLVSNAKDAMPNGGKLTIETNNVTLEGTYMPKSDVPLVGDYVLLSVSDTGVGMSEDTKKRLFEPFFTTKQHGTGLGLATCYNIAKKANGDISVYSEPEVGTTMKVYLPRSKEPYVVSSEDQECGQPAGGSETILVVEDDETIRTLMKAMLIEQGYRVIEAKEGAHALRTARREASRRIDLLFTDIVMPKIRGTELAERLRAARPGIKVLLTSAYTEMAAVRAGLLQAGTAYIQKPFRKEDLIRTVRKLLDE